MGETQAHGSVIDIRDTAQLAPGLLRDDRLQLARDCEGRLILRVVASNTRRSTLPTPAKHLTSRRDR